MKITIDDNLIAKHFTDEQIKGFMKELDMTRLETILYLWAYNNIGVCRLDLKDNGRPMYRKFAKGFGKLLQEHKEI